LDEAFYNICMDAVLSLLMVLLLTAPASVLAHSAPHASQHVTISQIVHRPLLPVPTTTTHEPAPILHTTLVPVQTSTSTSLATAPYVDELEADILTDMNAIRTQNGLPLFESDTKLGSISRSHSADMLAKNFFSHTDLTGCDAVCRLNEVHYNWSFMGENIHMMSGYNETAEAAAQKVVDDWMASPPHRENLLNPAFTHVGVGIAQSGSTLYTTADYALPR
jgi:uncharacterized protein YkwD